MPSYIAISPSETWRDVASRTAVTRSMTFFNSSRKTPPLRIHSGTRVTTRWIVVSTLHWSALSFLCLWFPTFRGTRPTQLGRTVFAMSDQILSQVSLPRRICVGSFSVDLRAALELGGSGICKPCVNYYLANHEGSWY